MKEFLFKFEGKYYITSCDTQMDAEMKFWEEIGFDPETCRELNLGELNRFVLSGDGQEVIYF